MKIPLGKVIVEAIPVIEAQVGEAFDKYQIEEQFHWPPARSEFHTFAPLSFEIHDLSWWSIDEEAIYLIVCLHHDMITRAYRIQNILDLEKQVLSYFLNPLITYIVPVIGGAVCDFEVFTPNGYSIKKHENDEGMHHTSGDDLHIRWL